MYSLLTLSLRLSLCLSFSAPSCAPQAIEDKQVAEQNAERAKFVVAKAEQEKEALIIRSEGDSEAARLVSAALQQSGKGLIELRRIETAVQVSVGGWRACARIRICSGLSACWRSNLPVRAPGI